VERRAIRKWTAALVLLCAGCLWLQFRNIERTLPYPHDIDEGYVAGPAARTIVTGTLHPYNFIYPSLPKYLAAVGMAVGFVRAAGQHEITEIQKLGNAGFPYYQTPRALQGARELFAFLSVVTLAAIGVAGWLAFRKPAAILLSPLVLAASPLFFYHSWTYLNVDIVGACFVVLTLVACLHAIGQPSIQRSALVPGVCAGLATGSKYTLALVIVPVLLAIQMYVPAGRRVQACLAAIAAMAAAFLIAVPYSLLDIPLFLNGVAFSAAHYSGGHVGAEGEPGLAQLAYYARHFASDFGAVGAALAVLGVLAFGIADWRRAVVLFSFPFGLIWLLVAHRVRFARNVLGLHPMIAMAVAYGIVAVHGWAMREAHRRGWTSPRVERPVSLLVGLLLVVVAIPATHVRDQFRDRTDSRKLAQAWIESRLPPDWTIVIPSQLAFDARGLEARGFHVVDVNLQSAANADALRGLLSGVQEPAVILVPRWGADSRFSGQEIADALNEVSRHWRVEKTFGTNPVLVNYSQPNPSGDPAFAIATLERRRIPDH